MYIVYVLENSHSKKIYIGYTADLEKRLKRHNGELPTKKSSYTTKNKSNGIWIVIYKESFLLRSEAMKREKELKSSRGRAFIKNMS